MEITEQQLLLSEHVKIMNTYGLDSNELKAFMNKHKDKTELISLCETAMLLKKALMKKS